MNQTMDQLIEMLNQRQCDRMQAALRPIVHQGEDLVPQYFVDTGLHANADSSARVPEVEEILDHATEGLLGMNAETLLRLASLYRKSMAERRDMIESVPCSLPDAVRVRLSWKLLLFERVLRQTRANLVTLGLGEGHHGILGTMYRAGENEPSSACRTADENRNIMPLLY